MKKIKIISLCLLFLVAIFGVVGCDTSNDKDGDLTTYEILSNSMAPTLVCGDKVKVESKGVYIVGDIVMFESNSINFVHRIICILSEDDVTYYICHGDNVQSANPSNHTEIVPWHEDASYIQNLVDNGRTLLEIQNLTQNIRVVTINQIEGVVVKVN